MSKIILTLILVFTCSNAFAGDYVFHTNGVITGKTKSCGAVCSQRPDALLVDRATFNSITKYHKVENGQVVAMTQAEIDAIVQVETDARRQALLAAIDKYEVSNLDLLTALVKRINVRIPSNPITKAEIIQQIKDDLGL